VDRATALVSVLLDGTGHHPPELRADPHIWGIGATKSLVVDLKAMLN
jgi:hypothetical protein